MSVRMLIDASHPEETRVAVVHGNRVEEFDFESATKKQLKGNIYLAKVTRVEPSLQAAFVEYGGNRHGFLAFSEIHPDYYQIPVADRQALLAEDAAAHQDYDDMDSDHEPVDRHELDEDGDDHGHDDENGNAHRGIEQLETDDDLTEKMRNRPRLIKRHYKIQEVIKRRQILLIQVVKEERGNKGAALTTYLSLAGRYCVLMPNTLHGGGVSRKIANPADRKKLKSVLSELKMVEGMATIIRTAGLSRTKTEIKRDFDYLTRLWEGIRDLTMRSMAPALIHEEGDLIKRSIRDLYSRDIDEIQVEGEEGYKAAKQFMRLLMPSHAKKVQHYKDRIPLFHKYQVEGQLDQMFSPEVRLKSGGYIVINPTEALVAIDVNSGRATREHHIEETAYKTNLEAAEEVGRQLRLRDMAGLIVIDFIDMEDRNNVRNVERKLKDCLKSDRARIQVGHISPFGLMEMSRQRLRPGMLEASTLVCHICSGTGSVRSVESSALHALRSIEEEGIRARSSAIHVRMAPDVAIYLLNKKRTEIIDMERRYGFRIEILAGNSLIAPAVEIDREGTGPDPELAAEYVSDGRAVEIEAELPEDFEEEEVEETTEAEAESTSDEAEAEGEVERPRPVAVEGEAGEERPRRKRRRRRKRSGAAAGETGVAGEQGQPETAEMSEGEGEGEAEVAAEAPQLAGQPLAEGEEGEGAARKRRRRGRRGGRKRSRTDEGQLPQAGEAVEAGEAMEVSTGEAGRETEVPQTELPAQPQLEEVTEAKPKAKPRARKPKAAKAEEAVAEVAVAAPVEAVEAKAEEPVVKKPARSRKKVAEAEVVEAAPKPKARAPRAKKAPAQAEALPEVKAEVKVQAVVEAPAQPVKPAKAQPAAPEPVAAETSEEPQGPRKKGWWQRPFSS